MCYIVLTSLICYILPQYSDVLLDNKRVTDYEVFGTDFPEDWVRGLKSVKGHPFARQYTQPNAIQSRA